MSDWTFDRAAAMGGLGFVVLAGGASAIAPTTLALDSGADEIRSKLAAHADALGTGALLSALATLAVGFFLAHVHERLRSVETPKASSLPACFAIAGTAIVSGLAGLGAVSVLYTTGEQAPQLLDFGAFALAGLWMAAAGIVAAVRPAATTAATTTAAAAAQPA